jgi:myo-inositol-1(or 4)-monophosphatase
VKFAGPAEKIAREAGALLRDFYHRGVRTEYKGDVDLVTEADRASEKLIVARLQSQFPNHGIVGEEGTSEHKDNEYLWYVDPLDGTTNFAHSFPVFCVSLGLVRQTCAPEPELIAGVVYDPLRDEMFCAERGAGATLNGAPMHVTKTASLAESLLATGFPSHKRHQNPNINFYHQFTLRSHGVRSAGSAALDLAYTACGRFDAYWELNLNPWDIAAGALLVLEAGGTITDFSGGQFQLKAPEILATNGKVFDEMKVIFADMLAGRNLSPIPTPAEYAARRRAENSA